MKTDRSERYNATAYGALNIVERTEGILVAGKSVAKGEIGRAHV